MTLDDAIMHARETAEYRTDLCESCRAEHMQLANWLEELRDLRIRLEAVQDGDSQ